jgi:hypothetical protein
MKKALVILYYWPPSGGMAVQRWLKFTKYLREFDWEPVIVAPENAHYPETDHSLEQEIPEGIQVIRVPIFEPSRLYGKFIGSKEGENIGVSFALKKKPSKFASVKNSLSLWVRGNLVIPDAHVFWVRPVYRHLKRYLGGNPVDVIITTGTPHSLHLIGLKLRRKFDIPWVADFRDLWTKIDFYQDLKLTRLADRIHHHLERKVVSGADHVITVGDLWKEEFLQIGAKQVTVITNGYDPEDVPQEEPVPDRKFTIVHVGSVGKNRDARALWEVLAHKADSDPAFARDLSLVFIGNVDFSVAESLKQAGLTKYITRIGYLSHRDAMRSQQNARLLLLLINNSADAKGRLTGKIFEYLASRRPILAIGPEDGEASKLLEATGTGHAADYNNAIRIGALVDSFYQAYREGKTDAGNFDPGRYSRRALSGNLAGLLDQVSHQKNRN